MLTTQLRTTKNDNTAAKTIGDYVHLKLKVIMIFTDRRLHIHLNHLPLKHKIKGEQ